MSGRTGMAGVRWALLFGNFVIGLGIMVAPGTLNDLSRNLGVSVSAAGQIIAAGAAAVCFGAPLLAGWVVFYAAGHIACALAPNYATLLPLRALTLLGAAVFTPQAAAAVGFMAPPAERGRDIAFIFLGWSVASVVGMPAAAWLGATHGWQSAFVAVAVLALVAAVWVHAVLPDGVRPAGLSLASWKQAFSNPVLMAIVAVTLLCGAGQFTLFSYVLPYYHDVLHASTAQTSLLLAWFGAFGILGSIALTRFIDRVGVDRSATLLVASIALTLALWPLAGGIVGTGLVLVPWAFGCFSANSAQQARLSAAAPALAPALLALNTSAIYLGQAAGAASGGWLIAHAGYGVLSWAGLGWLVVAIALSVWAMRMTGSTADRRARAVALAAADRLPTRAP